jgi:hypothetical protein
MSATTIEMMFMVTSWDADDADDNESTVGFIMDGNMDAGGIVSVHESSPT